MIVDFFYKLFSGISDVTCMDTENTDCLEELNIVKASVGNNFIYTAIALTLVFVLLAANVQLAGNEGV